MDRQSYTYKVRATEKPTEKKQKSQSQLPNSVHGRDSETGGEEKEKESIRKAVKKNEMKSIHRRVSRNDKKKRQPLGKKEDAHTGKQNLGGKEFAKNVRKAAKCKSNWRLKHAKERLELTKISSHKKRIN